MSNTYDCYQRWNKDGLGLKTDDCTNCLLACGVSQAQIDQNCVWLAEECAKISAGGRISVPLFESIFAKHNERVIVQDHFDVYRPPVHVHEVRAPRVFIGAPPAVDQFLLKDISHGGHGFDNTGFRSAMSQLETLEQEEERRIITICSGL